MADLAVSPRILQRLVSICFVLLLVMGPVSIVYLPGELEKANGDDFYGLLNTAILTDITIVMIECFMIPTLYLFMVPASRTISFYAALCRFTEIVIMCANVFPYVVAGAAKSGALSGVVGDGKASSDTGGESGADEVSSSITDSSPATTIVSLMIFIHNVGCKLWEIPFGIHIVLLGYLVAFRATFIPKSFGYLLLLGGIGYVMDAFAGIWFVDYGRLSTNGNVIGDKLQGLGSLIACIGEIPFFLYLSLKGCDVEAWYQQSKSNAGNLLDGIDDY